MKAAFFAALSGALACFWIALGLTVPVFVLEELQRIADSSPATGLTTGLPPSRRSTLR